MKKEQAEILVLRGLERKQQEIQSQMGFTGLTFREMIDRAPEQEKAELEKAYSRLSDSLRSFPEDYPEVKQAIDLNLHVIQKVLQKDDTKENAASSAEKLKIKDMEVQ